MSGAGVQVARQSGSINSSERQSSIGYLLHALNQPLTGLQCSLELAVSSPRSEEQYVRALREALELTGRMRGLVEALRELADLPSSVAGECSLFAVDEMLLAAAEELRAVAEVKGVHLRVVSGVPLPVQGARSRLTSVLFRVLSSALSLCDKETELRVVAAAENGSGTLCFSWTQSTLPKDSPFSRPELGLLLAQAVWQEAGGSCDLIRSDKKRTCSMRLPLRHMAAASQESEDRK